METIQKTGYEPWHVNVDVQHVPTFSPLLLRLWPSPDSPPIPLQIGSAVSDNWSRYSRQYFCDYSAELLLLPPKPGLDVPAPRVRRTDGRAQGCGARKTSCSFLTVTADDSWKHKQSSLQEFITNTQRGLRWTRLRFDSNRLATAHLIAWVPDLGHVCNCFWIQQIVNPNNFHSTIPRIIFYALPSLSGVSEPMKSSQKNAKPTFWSSWLAQLHQASWVKHGKRVWIEMIFDAGLLSARGSAERTRPSVGSSRERRTARRQEAFSQEGSVAQQASSHSHSS